MKIFCLICFVFLSNFAFAESYLLPSEEYEAIIGDITYVKARKEETLVDIARENNLGYDEIIKANPGVNRWIPGEGTKVLLPTKFILPDAPYKGIVLNLAELRLYYFPTSKDGRKNEYESQKVYTFPISIGRMDWKSPLGKTTITRKEKDPAWRPPASIKAEHAAEGDYLENEIPGGDPSNPLGHYALALGKPGYLIHGVNEQKEYGIGMRVTHGCIRMYSEDIQLLFSMVEVGTPVLFIDQSLKVAWQDGELFIEVHSPLEEDEQEFAYSHTVTREEAKTMIAEKINSSVVIDSNKLTKVLSEANGIPAAITSTDNSVLPPARRLSE